MVESCGASRQRRNASAHLIKSERLIDLQPRLNRAERLDNVENVPVFPIKSESLVDLQPWLNRAERLDSVETFLSI